MYCSVSTFLEFYFVSHFFNFRVFSSNTPVGRSDSPCVQSRLMEYSKNIFVFYVPGNRYLSPRVWKMETAYKILVGIRKGEKP